MIDPLRDLQQHFKVYHALVEHVIDIDKLPDLVVNPEHDEALAEIREQMDALEQQVNNNNE